MSAIRRLEYSDNYSKTTGSLWQYYRDEQTLSDAGTIEKFLVIPLCSDLKKK